MSNKKMPSDEVKMTGTCHSGEKFPDLNPVVPFVDVVASDNDSGVPNKVALKVRIDPAKWDERSDLTKIKIDMLEDLHGQSAQYVHTCYLLEQILVFPKQGIMLGDKDCFKHLLHIFESLLGLKMKSTFASLLGRAVEEVIKLKGWMIT